MFDFIFFLFPALFVAIGVFFFRRNKKIVRERFQTVAERCKGRVVESAWYLCPRLVFDLDGVEMQVMGMHGGKNQTAKTFTWVGCDEYPKKRIELRRLPKRAGLLERMGWEAANTGQRDFDEVFWQKADDEEVVRTLLDDELRGMLLAFDEKRRIHLSLAETTAFRDGRMLPDRKEWRLDVSIRGLPAEVEDIQRLVETTALAHLRLQVRALRSSA